MTHTTGMSARTLATYLDLAALGDDARAEIIHGAIIEKAAPSFEHGVAQSALSGTIGQHFGRRGGGGGPGGWWIASEVEVEYAAHEVFRHDVAGWRRERVPEMPHGSPTRIFPDWVCEILSPSNAKRDLVDKLRVLQASGVPHYWILDPVERVLLVHRLEASGYVVALTAAPGERVRAEPFDALEVNVGALFGDDEEDSAT